MLTVISPAKTLDYETPPHIEQSTQPRFLSNSAELINVLDTLSVQGVAELMKLSDKLASLNVARYNSWPTDLTSDNSKQAIFAFKGDVYTGLDASTLSEAQLNYAQQHLRILSGLYGVLRPLDLMYPYRLEMGTKLATPRGTNLYQFWDLQLTESLNEELSQDDHPTIINLASNEYFKAIKPKALNARVVMPIFKDWKSGQYKIISFYAKKARGLMARYILENQINEPDALKNFDYEGYRFAESMSEGDSWVFIRDHEE
ncbi:peroxide stress protein YaaA [Neptunomonas japonica]|uniref:peroxide stress protein YaaA n=1 Tax=Neptunomonas japonica TaxID=417574 RepID=UPI00041D8FCC|nr:peroxide stress protein YaaA [Neptunomonas japonica]